MTQEIENYIEKYPEEVRKLFMQIRDVIFSVEGVIVEEKMWAKLPSYFYGEKFVRIIPFKDYINIEAEGLGKYKCEFEGCKFTPKGMLQIQVDQIVSFDALKKAFSETYM